MESETFSWICFLFAVLRSSVPDDLLAQKPSHLSSLTKWHEFTFDHFCGTAAGSIMLTLFSYLRGTTSRCVFLKPGTLQKLAFGTKTKHFAS